MLKKSYLPIFETARLKLTAWYVLIIMLVSFSFTAYLYNGVSQEFRRRLINIEQRFSTNTPEGFRIRGPVHEYFIEDLEAARNRVILILLYANGFLFILSTALGNYLAGKALEPIEESLDEQKRFVADASHELKTPITALQTSIEVTLRDKNLTLKEAKKTLRENLKDVENLKVLSNELLALARINDISISREKINTKKLILKAVNKFIPQAEKKNIKITKRLRPVIIKADREQIEKLASILLDNAIKYTEKGGKISISTEVTDDGRIFILKVKDNGIGISDKHIEKIFDRFYRAEPSRTKMKVEGYGLGLSLAKKIVDKHEGLIKVDSKEGKGSTFSVRIPI